jgi:hypothetical protein
MLPAMAERGGSFDADHKKKLKKGKGRLLQPPPRLKLSLRSNPPEASRQHSAHFALEAGSSPR